MQSNTSLKIKTGIFVTAGLAVLLFIIIFIGNQKNLFRSTIKLHVNYRTVAGLQEGSFVRFAGINVGTVDLIDIINDTTVRVEISVQKKIKQFIKVDSKASIANDGLMGDKLVQILPGGETSSRMGNDGQLIAVNPFDMEKVMAKVEKVGSKIESIVSNIDTLSGNLAGIFGKVNNGQGTLGKLINSEKLSNDLEQTVASAKKTVKTANKAAEGLSENMEAAKSNFLLKGYFKKKEKKRIADSIAKAKAQQKPKN
jgi:phospholipid/cholesterol/gamma-HCH transport system substrate-binding protein